MGAKTKPSQRRAVAKAEKLIKVSPEVHQRIKVNAALADKKMGDYIDEKTRE